MKRVRKSRDEAEGDARKPLEEALKSAEDPARKNGQQPLPYETLYAVGDASSIEDVSIHLKGDPTKTGDLVPRRFLSMLNGAEVPPSDPTPGGAHPFPPQHEWKFTQHYPFKAVYETSDHELNQHAWQSLVRSLMRLNEFVYVD